MLRPCIKAATIGGLMALGLFAAGQRPAHATITMTFGSVTGPVGNFTWSYNGVVSNLSRVNGLNDGTPGPGGVGAAPGDFFTFYDVLGLIPGSETMPANWVVTEQPLGATPGFNLLANNDAHYPGVIPPDDPLITNVTFRYSPGAAIAPILGGPTGLGAFTFRSSTNLGALDAGASADHVNNPGATDNQSESSNVPVFRPSILAVPEPGTMALFGLGAVGLFLKLRRRRKTE
jgi:hypothetical protein